MNLKDGRMPAVANDVNLVAKGLKHMDEHLQSVPEFRREQTRRAFYAAIEAAMAQQRLEAMPEEPPIASNHPIAKWPELKSQFQKTNRLYRWKNRVIAMFRRRKKELKKQSST